MLRPSILVLLPALLSAAAPAGGAVLCKPSNGTLLRVREACKLHETQVDPVALGLQGPPGPSGPGYVVKDSQGVFVGSAYIGTNGDATVVHTLDASHTVRFIVSSDGTALESASDILSYTSFDCTGTPYIHTGNPLGLAAEAVVPAVGASVYYPPAVGTVLTMHSLSDGVSCFVGDATQLFIAAAGPLTFTAPFHLEPSP